jgi:hypothetical protein
LSGALGRLPPTDLRHVDKYPIAARYTIDEIPRVPVVIGVNWYSAFDRPIERWAGETRSWWLPEPGSWGYIRGGHAVCLKPTGVTDVEGWWDFYNQGSEGACVGFAWSRCMSLLNRARYDGPWLYHEAQKIDEWPGEAYSGTSVRAGGRILVDRGHKTPLWTAPRPAQGVAAYRWATSLDELRQALRLNAGGVDRPYVTLLNSWGRGGYPHLTRVPLATLDRLIFREGGDAAIPTDR